MTCRPLGLIVIVALAILGGTARRRRAAADESAPGRSTHCCLFSLATQAHFKSLRSDAARSRLRRGSERHPRVPPQVARGDVTGHGRAMDSHKACHGGHRAPFPLQQPLHLFVASCELRLCRETARWPTPLPCLAPACSGGAGPRRTQTPFAVHRQPKRPGEHLGVAGVAPLRVLL